MHEIVPCLAQTKSSSWPQQLFSRNLCQQAGLLDTWSFQAVSFSFLLTCCLLPTFLLKKPSETKVHVFFGKPWSWVVTEIWCGLAGFQAHWNHHCRKLLDVVPFFWGFAATLLSRRCKALVGGMGLGQTTSSYCLGKQLKSEVSNQSKKHRMLHAIIQNNMNWPFITMLGTSETHPCNATWHFLCRPGCCHNKQTVTTAIHRGCHDSRGYHRSERTSVRSRLYRGSIEL